MKRRKRPAAGQRRASGAKDDEARAKKFWVPPSVRGGGKPASSASPGPSRRYFVPEDFGLEERTDTAATIRARRVDPITSGKTVERLGVVTLTWYGNPRRPHGVIVEGYPGHDYVSAYRIDAKIKYDDPLLAAADGKGSRGEPGGYCRQCDEDDCKAVRWALERLYKKNPIPF